MDLIQAGAMTESQSLHAANPTFLNLPAEVREMIYVRLLGPFLFYGYAKYMYLLTRLPKSVSQNHIMPMLRVSRKIHAEAQHVLYTYPTFVTETYCDHDLSSTFFDTLQPYALRMLRSIFLRTGFDITDRDLNRASNLYKHFAQLSSSAPNLKRVDIRLLPHNSLKRPAFPHCMEIAKMLLDAISPFLGRDIELTTSLGDMETRHDPIGGDLVSADIEICARSLGLRIDLPDSCFIVPGNLPKEDFVRDRLHWNNYI